MATNTTATTQNHNGTGSQNNFAISFSFLANTEVNVKVGGVLKTLGTHYNIVGSQVQFTSGNTPPSGTANVVFTRDTNISAKKVDFADGSVLTETDLDNNSDQILFAQQEIINDFIKRDGSTSITGNLVFEGATDDGNETTLAITDPTDDRTITVPDRSGTLITSGDTGTVTSTMIADGTIVNADVNASAAIDQSKLNIANATTSAAGYQSAADKTKLDGIESNATADQTAAEIRTLVDNATDSNVFTDAEKTKLTGIEASATADQTAAEIRTLVGNATDSNVFTDAEKTKLNGIESGATADQNASEIKTLYESNSNTNVLTDAEKTVIDGVTANTSELNKLDGYTGSTADLNQVSGMSKQTTITNSDSHFPTSGAVVDFVANQIAPVGGLEVIADEDSFPTTQPVSGVVISISNADGLVINSSGVATNARTVGSGSDNVTINNFPTSLRSKTLSNELGLLVSSTGASQVYNYHKLLAKETDVLQLSEDINDFGNRYRVVSSNPTSDNDAGDLIFNTSTQKLLVYNATSGAFEEAQSVGNFFISTLSPAFNGSVQDFTITNAPSNAQQIILSINGVIQKPNAGTSTPSEGFALSGSTVKLAAAPASGSDYFAIVLGSTVNIGTPSNNTVTSAMIVDGSIVNGDISNSADIAGSKLSLVSTSSTAGIIVKGDGSSDGYLQLNCSQNSHGIKLKSPPHSAGASYTFTFPQNIQNGQFLTTDANGNTSWSAIDLTALSASNLTSGTIPDARFPATLPAVSGANLTGINTDLVSDTTPQLGGTLDLNGNQINGADSNGSSTNMVLLGSGNDLKMYHDGNNSYLSHDNGSGHLYLQGDAIRLRTRSATNNDDYIVCSQGGPVSLYHNNVKRLETDSYGITCGNVHAGSSTISNPNTTYVVQAAAPSQAYISAYRGNTGTNLASHGFHFGIDVTSHNLIGRENKPMYFYTNNAHACTIDTNQHFVPAGNNSKDLGTGSLRWRNIYTNDLNLSNEGGKNDVDGTWGSFTIQEGSEDLFLINKRNGKKYKFNLTEVS